MTPRNSSDNNQQVAEILEFCHHLEDVIGHAINPDIAAHIWIRKFAKSWRNDHPF
jgi:hypothetical protein